MLTSENYFSLENQMKYMGASQYKDFEECEAMALAIVEGRWKEEETVPLLVGSYVDAYFEGSIENFKLLHPNIFSSQGKTKGELKGEYKQAEYIIKRLEQDELFMRYMSGSKQVILTGEISGVPFKIKIDSYHPKKTIVDMKIMKDFKPLWKDGQRLNFVQYWKYDVGGAIYQEIERQNSESKKSIPFRLAAATKEKVMDKVLLEIPQDSLNFCLDQVKQNVVKFDSIKKRLIKPTRCGFCDYCKSTKILKNVITYDPTKADIFEGVEV